MQKENSKKKCKKLANIMKFRQILSKHLEKF